MGDYEENLSRCLEQAKLLFSAKFTGEAPTIAVCAPGRVNLIGEHTDYNNGLVLPMALPRMTVVVGRRSPSTVCSAFSASIKSSDRPMYKFSIPVYPGDKTSEPVTTDPEAPSWTKYIVGVVGLMNEKSDIPAFDAVITSCVPLGGGVSSSAALEVAMALFVEQLRGMEKRSPVDLALLCQQAEHRYARNPCGIMDQFVSMMAQEGHALMIDCSDNTSSAIPFSNPELAVLVIDSGKKHALVDGEYAQRRDSCYAAAKTLGVDWLRSASMELLKQKCDGLGGVEYRRARHVISEIARTQRAVEVLQKQDYEAFGKLMNESHDSLRDDYEVSCAELNELVTLARQDKRVYGSRMTGGGFGGCTVTFLPKDIVDQTIERIKEQYLGGKAEFYVATASPGARVLQL